MKCANYKNGCKEKGCNSEKVNSPLYCDLCFWMKRMDKEMVMKICKMKIIKRFEEDGE